MPCCRNGRAAATSALLSAGLGSHWVPASHSSLEGSVCYVCLGCARLVFCRQTSAPCHWWLATLCEVFGGFGDEGAVCVAVNAGVKFARPMAAGAGLVAAALDPTSPLSAPVVALKCPLGWVCGGALVVRTHHSLPLGLRGS